MVVSLINLYMHGHLISEHWTWHISASSVVGCSLTDDYWIMHIHDVRNSSTQDYLAVLIDLISALFFTQLPGPEFCPVVSCCIGRREGAGKEARFAAAWNDSRWHRWLCWAYTVSEVLADCYYHTHSLSSLGCHIPSIQCSILICITSSGEDFLEEWVTIITSVARSILYPASPLDCFFSAHVFL